MCSSFNLDVRLFHYMCKSTQANSVDRSIANVVRLTGSFYVTNVDELILNKCNEKFGKTFQARENKISHGSQLYHIEISHHHWNTTLCKLPSSPIPPLSVQPNSKNGITITWSVHGGSCAAWGPWFIAMREITFKMLERNQGGTLRDALLAGWNGRTLRS